ncbi:type IV toxin-antitoxin system AbiEi family antitoxin domain-containing protein [Cognatiyoonia sp. IB215182]|uniref:type IV toxin-antitoxin system AbiEi family antitoxin domain-containing protein n=1 Tax=Cognatiyoonia sp. IB215182 TaxID=3097353 RepID=UPI002A0F2AD5|nr:type IV toxin-antitoxin system AbiEi family antitoxin domain-containing protein [Cognatiyoonia sp. IB215182]MDX8355258.1 type IV toxin-antitoxin system AbiEi family antitoxin domain-containing protein [Cognatiyoonia sp. IB215182]
MSAGRSQNLKKVLEAVPPGYLVDAAWLAGQSVAYETFRDYVKRGWLERVHRGVFRRPVPNTSGSNTIPWNACLLSMQHIMNYEVHIGGTIALSQQGYDHYLRLGRNAPVWVYGDATPKWLSKLPLDAPIETRKTSLFTDPALGLTENTGKSENTLPWEWQLQMSAPERAVMEALDELPDHGSFHNLDMIFEGLTTLRPKLLSALLLSCTKIKVRRLFFVFADRHNHPWRKRLDPKAFDLGAGDRALVKGGKIHPQYRIMVPEEFVRTEVDNGAQGL